MNRIFKIGALPNYFKGSFADVSFEVINQFDIYNKVDCIIQDLDTGKKILQLNEKSDPIIETKKFITYVNKNSDYDANLAQERNIKKFVLDIIREIKLNNRKNKVVKNEFPIKNKKMPVLKKGSQAAKNKMQAVRDAKKQTGSSNIKIDKLIQAKPPGKRITKSGSVYYESRANRSDKGVLLGIPLNDVKKEILQDFEMTTKRIDLFENNKINLTKNKNQLTFKKSNENIIDLKIIIINIKLIDKYLLELKKHKNELKKLI